MRPSYHEIAPVFTFGEPAFGSFLRRTAACISSGQSRQGGNRAWPDSDSFAKGENFRW